MTIMKKETRSSQTQIGSEGEKKHYETPTIVEYGSVAKLTQSGQGSGNDGGAGSMMMQCL